MEIAVHQGRAEALGLVERRRLEGRHHGEGRALVVQQALDGLRARDESRVHRLEVQEELGDVLEELTAENAVGHLVEGPTGDVEHAAAALAAHAVRQRQPAQQPAAEEVRHPRRRIEEVDRVAGRGRVDHDEVVLATRVDLEQPLHRDVVVTLHEPRGEVVVEPVLEDAVCRHLVGRVHEHEVVPRLLGVEHRRPELAARFDACGLQHLRWDAVRAIAETLEPERGREAARRVDREHEHLAAEMHGRAERGGRRDRGLADAARPAEDDDLLGGQQLVERDRGVGRRPAGVHSPSSAPRASATMRVTRRPCARTNRYGT